MSLSLSCSGTLGHQVTLPSPTDIISAEPLPSLCLQYACMCTRIYKTKKKFRKFFFSKKKSKIENRKIEKSKIKTFGPAPIGVQPHLGPTHLGIVEWGSTKRHPEFECVCVCEYVCRKWISETQRYEECACVFYFLLMLSFYLG